MLKPKSNMNSTHICHDVTVACVSTIIIIFTVACVSTIIIIFTVACVSTIPFIYHT